MTLPTTFQRPSNRQNRPFQRAYRRGSNAVPTRFQRSSFQPPHTPLGALEAPRRKPGRNAQGEKTIAGRLP